MGKVKEILEILVNDAPRVAGANPQGPNLRNPGEREDDFSKPLSTICR
jgi:hypothetical protein